MTTPHQSWPPAPDEEIDGTMHLGWSEPEWTNLRDIPEGHRAWLERADLPDVRDDAILAARARIQHLLDIWVDGIPDVDKRPRPAHVSWIAVDVVRDLRDVLRALDDFLVDAPVQDTAALPYVRAWVQLRTKIYEMHAAGTPHADTYAMVLDALHDLYPPRVGFKIRPGTYKGRRTPF